MIGKMRLGLKKAYERLPLTDRNNFMDDLRGLYNIDPFRRLTIIILAFLFILFLGHFKLALWFAGLYLIWVLLYFITFLGIYLQFKDKVSGGPRLKRHFKK